GVVYQFELIDVGHDDPEGEVVAQGAAELARGPLYDGAAIGELGEFVGESELFKEAILGLDLAVKGDNAAPHSSAREEFIGVEGFREVLIRARLKALYDLRFFGYASEDDDVGEAVLKIGANALAQLDTAEVGHQPVCYDQAGLMPGK